MRACAREGEETHVEVLGQTCIRDRATTPHPQDAHESSEELLGDESWCELMRMRWKMTRRQLEDKIEEFFIDCRCRGKSTHYNLTDTKSHFNSWLMIQTNINQRQYNGRDNNNTASTPAQRRREAEELMLRLLNGDGGNLKDDDLPF